MMSIDVLLQEFMKHLSLTEPWAFENHILHAFSKGLVEFCTYMPWSFKPNELISVQGRTGFSLLITLWVCFRLCKVQFCASAVSCAVWCMWAEDDNTTKQTSSLISFREWIEPNMSGKMALELGGKTQWKSDQQRDYILMLDCALYSERQGVRIGS